MLTRALPAAPNHLHGQRVHAAADAIIKWINRLSHWLVITFCLNEIESSVETGEKKQRRFLSWEWDRKEKTEGREKGRQLEVTVCKNHETIY